MTGFTPVILVSGATPLFYSRLIKATVRDEEGQKSDTLTIELDDRGNVIPEPKKGTQLGYRESGMAEIGTFEVHGSEMKGAAGEGEFITVQAKGTSLATTRKLKEIGNEDFPENATLKDVAGRIAGRSGLSLRLAGALATVRYPEGVFRHAQSDLDFLHRLVERANGLMKISGDVLAIAERGSGQSASGKPLPTITIRKQDCKEWSYTPGDRPTYGKTVAHWTDQKTGKKRAETRETGLEGPLFAIRETFRNEAEAKKAVEAKSKELSRRSGKVTFTVPGRADGGAGCTVNALGFRPEISGSWRAKAVEHVFTAGPSGGWTTKFECEAPEGGKKS
jgi:uncharacterized protein